VLSSRFKPDQKQIELAVALDTSSGNFNKSKAEQVKDFWYHCFRHNKYLSEDLVVNHQLQELMCILDFPFTDCCQC